MNNLSANLMELESNLKEEDFISALNNLKEIIVDINSKVSVYNISIKNLVVNANNMSDTITHDLNKLETAIEDENVIEALNIYSIIVKKAIISSKEIGFDFNLVLKSAKLPLLNEKKTVKVVEEKTEEIKEEPVKKEENIEKTEQSEVIVEDKKIEVQTVKEENISEKEPVVIVEKIVEEKTEEIKEEPVKKEEKTVNKTTTTTKKTPSKDLEF